MSISEAASHRDSSGNLNCPRCGTPLLPQATFCSSCGERLDEQKTLSSLLQNEQDITTRYRITSLVRRRPYINLYFALDNQNFRQGQQRMVAIRDIDINSLDDEARVQAIKLVQQEYDLLRLWRLPHVMSVIDVRFFHGHLFVISDYPLAGSSLSTTGKSENTKVSTGNVRRLYTLQDFLQSGQGLPSEQRALEWIRYLCQALDGLHRHQIAIGELDPYTIILNENSDNAEPALMISWLSPHLRELLPPPRTSRTSLSYFCAPEALQGKTEPRSDIYSLGTILYLLLTGSLPTESTLRTRGRLRTSHELNGRVSPHVSDCVMQALSIEPSKRFQNPLEMSQALFNPRYSHLQTPKLNRRDNEVPDSPATTDDDVGNEMAHRQASHPQKVTTDHIPHRPLIPRPTPQLQEVEPIQAKVQQQPVVPPQSPLLPAAPTIDANTDAVETIDTSSQNETVTPWFKQLQRLILGQQQHAIMAAAIIESPLSVQPNQVFTLRLHILGRNEPAPPPGANEVDRSTRLSHLVYGDTFSVEVHTVLNQRDAYVVQQATVTIPAAGYIAEVTIPVQPLNILESGKRNRFHIFFLDQQRHPLYEKPFVVEVFVSHYVKRAHEGYQVLTIPR